jgi:hypothetical protein
VNNHENTKMENDRITSVGIFFDGTGNNGINAASAEMPVKNNESYQGAPTNIYKLFGLFNGDCRLYVEGIGTLTGGEDRNFAMATCANPPGEKGYSSDDKLQKAYDFAESIMIDQNRIYHFYIYGFSRGSMLARHFSNQLLIQYPSANIKIKFLGVFDTVESKPFNTYEVQLSQQVENALHIGAVNECRYFFPLTGFFENSASLKDTKTETLNTVWKEIFVPGAHADVGGGYLEGPQSVYISTDFMNVNDLRNYVSDIRNAKTDADGNKIWDSLLSEFQIDKGEWLSQAYVARNRVYNELSKIYGQLMLEETNTIKPEIFSTHLKEQDLDVDPENHPFLSDFYSRLKAYALNMEPEQKPQYDYRRFAEYTHISANFGLYSDGLLKKSAEEVRAELINNGLNVPSSSSLDHKSHMKVLTELHLPEDSFIPDFLYGTNIPNNDIWSRTVEMKKKGSGMLKEGNYGRLKTE